MEKKDRIFAFTDGSTQSNPGIGGYASVFVDWNKNEILHQHCEFLDVSTNNQAELLATIYSIEWFLENYNDDNYLVIMSDSKYCTLGFNDRLETWKERDWKTTTKKRLKNLSLWKKLYEYKKKGNIYFQWVKGHDGNKYNEIADELSRNIWKKKLINE